MDALRPMFGRAGGARRVRRGTRGLTLIELSIAIVILIVALSGMAASMASGLTLNQVNRETALAQEAARDALEGLLETPVGNIWANFNALSPNNGFAVAGLQPQAGDPDGLVGQFVFPDALDGAGGIDLLENTNDAGLGMPRDLNGDGLVNFGVDVGAPGPSQYVLLPVRVVIQWRGASGNRTYTAESILVNR